MIAVAADSFNFDQISLGGAPVWIPLEVSRYKSDSMGWNVLETISAPPIQGGN